MIEKVRQWQDIDVSTENMNKVALEVVWIGLALVMGFLFSALLVPELVLHPTNIDILRGDPLWHFLGWSFYRESPWSWPLTYTQTLLYPMGISIVFTDSMPLLAIFLKLFSKFLPEPFNFFSVVCVLNSALMFYSGSLLLRVLRPNVFFNLVGGFFVLVSSVFLWRFFGHFALTAQWIIIFELLLIMKPHANLKKDMLYQCLLMFIAAGVHPYFFGMIVPLSLALCWKFYHRHFCSRLRAVAIFIFFIFSAFIFAWFFGWFGSHTSGSGSGFGFYSTNVLSFINPIYGSVLLHPFSVGPGQYEGFCYLGLGLLIPLVGLFFLSFHRKSSLYSRDYRMLLILLAAYFIFALSDVIQIGSYSITLSHATSGALGIFRSSGRFVWPVFYFVQFFILIELYDYLSAFPIKRGIIFSGLLLLQVMDNRGLMESVKKTWLPQNYLASAMTEAHINNEKWFHLSDHGSAQHLFIFQDIDTQPKKIAFTYVAFKNYMSMNNPSIGRGINRATRLYFEDQLAHVLKGEFLPNTVYVGLANDHVYPKHYCVRLDEYVVCTQDRALYRYLLSTPK